MSVNSFGSSLPPASHGSTGGARKAAAGAPGDEGEVVEEDDNDVYSDESDEEQPGPRGAVASGPPPAGAALVGSSFTQRITDAVRASAAAAASAPTVSQPSLQDMMKGAVHEVLKEFREKAAAVGSFNSALGAPSHASQTAFPGAAAVLGNSHANLGSQYLAEALRAVQQRPSASPAAAAVLATHQGDHSAAARTPPPVLDVHIPPRCA